MPETVLVADDEVKIVDLVATYLEAAGFFVLRARNGREALAAFRDRAPDCLILDLNMPAPDGLAVAREVRRSSAVPVIFLTARADEIDRIVGFELGADDYVPKPFSPRELVARVKAVLRRHGGGTEPDSSRMVRGSLSIDAQKRTCSLGGTPVDLTTVQMDILLFMMRSPGRVWTRLELLDAASANASGNAFDGYERTIDAHIKNIRKALGDDSERPRFLETVRGIGYRFMEQP